MFYFSVSSRCALSLLNSSSYGLYLNKLTWNNFRKNIISSKSRSICTIINGRHYSSSSSVTNLPKESNLIQTKLESRGLIRLTGPDTFPFLQGLITNDISHLEQVDQDALYSLILNHQGRVLYDVILYSSSQLGDQTLLECDASIKLKLLKHLTLYRVKKKVVITDANDLSVWVVFSQIKDINTKSELVIGEQRGIIDSRLCQLGWRFIVPKDQKLQLMSTTDENEYKKLLYSFGVGEGILDLPIGNSFPLESNGDYLHGISFHKGCYVGQELTARTHHTGVIRKRLMPFILPPNTTFPSTTDISKLEIKNQIGKSVGKVRNIIDTNGLALVRIEEALSASELKLNEITVTVKKPTWWPIELSKEIIKNIKKNE